MRESRWHERVGRVSLSCATILVMAAAIELIGGPHTRDDASFRAGHAASGDPVAIRHAMSVPGARPSTFCARLFDTQSSAGQRVRDDFIDGCIRAVGDAME